MLFVLFAAILVIASTWVVPVALLPLLTGGLIGVYVGWELRALSSAAVAAWSALAAGLGLCLMLSPLFLRAAAGPNVETRLQKIQAHMQNPWACALWIGSCVALALAASWLLSTRRLSAGWLGAACAAVSVAVVALGSMTLWQQNHYPQVLNAAARLSVPGPNDEELFAFVLKRIGSSESYYRAMDFGLRHWSSANGSSSVFTFRQPQLFRLWALAGANDIQRVAWLLLVLAVVAQVSSYLLALKYVEPSRASLAPLLMAPLLIVACTTRHLLLTETWAGLLSVCALCAWAYRRTLRGAEVLAACLALMAFVCREQAGALLLAALIAAIVERKRGSVVTWAAAGAVAAVVEAVHLWQVSLYHAVGSLDVAPWLARHPDPVFALATMRVGSTLLLFCRVLVPMCFVLAVLGALLTDGWSSRIVFGMTLVVPPVVFLFVHLGVVPI